MGVKILFLKVGPVDPETNIEHLEDDFLNSFAVMMCYIELTSDESAKCQNLFNSHIFCNMAKNVLYGIKHVRKTQWEHV